MSQKYLKCVDGDDGAKKLRLFPIRWIKSFEGTENFMQKEIFKLFIQSYFALEKKRDGYVPIQYTFYDKEKNEKKMQNYSLFYDKNRLKLQQRSDEPYVFYCTLLGPMTRTEFSSGGCQETLFKLIIDRSDENSFLFVLDRTQENDEKMLFCHVRVLQNILFLQCIEPFEQAVFAKDCDYSWIDGNVAYLHEINYKYPVYIVLIDEILLLIGRKPYDYTAHIYCHDLRKNLRYFLIAPSEDFYSIIFQECKFIERNLIYCVKERETMYSIKENKKVFHVDFDVENAVSLDN